MDRLEARLFGGGWGAIIAPFRSGSFFCGKIPDGLTNLPMIARLAPHPA
jgi:hypothetical protein